MKEDALTIWQKRNRSFTKKLAFRFGIEAGFFSEYNNMILAIAWCLQHQIKFSLYSKNAWFSEKGWTEFFEPFCKEEKAKIHQRINTRMAPPPAGKKTNLLIKWAKLRYGIDFFTWQLWSEFHNRNLEKEIFDFPELRVKGSIREVGQVMVSMTWRFNFKTKTIVNQLVDSINLPERYVGFHIRGGDKFKEDNLKPINDYFEASLNRTDCRNAFILTDDYRIIQETQAKYPDWKIYTLCTEDERGYHHQEFMKEPVPIIRKKLIRLFASIEILRNSQLFIGTFSSNPGMFLGMLMEPDTCIDVEGRDWLIW